MKQKLLKMSLAALIISCTMNVTQAQWNLTGNAGTGTSFLGTTNNFSLRLRTNNLQRMIVDSLGRVGIGTATPINILTVKGAGSNPAASWANAGAPLFVGFGEQTVGNADFILSQASTAFNARPVFIGRRSKGTLAAPAITANNDFLMSFLASGYDGAAFQNPAAIDFYVDGTPTAGNVPARISFVTGSNSTTRAERLKIGNTGDITMNTNQFFLQRSSGNVGIGTIAPTAKLDIVGNIKIVNGSQAAGRVLTSDANGLASWTTPGATPWTVSGTNISNSNSGNVGIGTTTPTEKLEVVGKFKIVGGQYGLIHTNGMVHMGTFVDSLGGQFGTNNKYNLGFYTNNSFPHVTLDTIGRLGVGTMAPVAKLDVAGNVKIADGTQAAGRVLTSDANGMASWTTPGATPWTVSGNNISNSNSGNVGIGTSAPTSKLDVRGNGLDDGGVLNLGNSDNSNQMILFGGRQNDPNPLFLVTANTPFRFSSLRNGYTELMRIDSIGRMGLGTNKPNAPLEVVADNSFGGMSILNNTSPDGFSGQYFKKGNQMLGYIGYPSGNSWINPNTFQLASTLDNMVFSVDKNGSHIERMRIDTNGNVGIGTTAPVAKFQVANGDIGYSGDLRRGISKNYNVNNGDCFGLEQVSGAQAGGPAMLRLYTSSANSAAMGFGKYTNATAFTEFARFDNNGNLCIGTTTPATGYKLTVAGKIICTELKVQVQPFPDYVFAGNYKLPSLKEVESHINTYHRLPGMPSATEVEANGMEVGKMQAKVVEKVEEATLYILQLSKENEALKNQLTEQGKAIAELQAALKNLQK